MDAAGNESTFATPLVLNIDANALRAVRAFENTLWISTTSHDSQWPDDRITGVNLPGVGAEFWVNGLRVGAVNDAAFARLFFGIWLDERTSEPKMRIQLLQGLQP